MTTVIMRLKAKIMQILVAELPPNQMGAFYLMRMGVEMPDAVTKTDLTNIITFLCKKLCWVEEEEDNKSFTTDTKLSPETNENDLPKDISADNGKIESEIPDMDWIDTLSDPIEENSKEERLVDGDISPQASGNVVEASENGNQQDNTSNDKIFTTRGHGKLRLS